GCALLGAVDGRGARGSAQGIGDVAGDRDLDAVQFGAPPGRVDPCQAAQVAAAWLQVAPLGVEQPVAQRLAEPGSAVVGRAAVAATSASTVPSPPSAIGTRSIAAPGAAWITPRAMASAAWEADMLPLYLSGAITTRIAAEPTRRPGPEPGAPINRANPLPRAHP